eukprot:5609437-Amphidinium_carterae.2
MKKAGLTEQKIDKTYEHFDESAPNLFNNPNVRNLTGLPQLREVQHEKHDYSGNEDDDEEDDGYHTDLGKRANIEYHQYKNIRNKSQ